MKTREYEAMFLLDNAAATADFDATAAQVDQILEKYGAEIVHKEKWDERKLAYEIKGHRRATYYLVYFRAPTQALTEVDQDLGLNEVVLRHLTIGLEEPMDEHIKKLAEDREKMAEESRKSSLSGWGDRKRGDRGSRRDRPRSGDAPAPAPETAATPAPGSAPAPAPETAATPAPDSAPAPAPETAATPEPEPAVTSSSPAGAQSGVESTAVETVEKPAAEGAGE